MRQPYRSISIALLSLLPLAPVRVHACDGAGVQFNALTAGAYDDVRELEAESASTGQVVKWRAFLRRDAVVSLELEYFTDSGSAKVSFLRIDRDRVMAVYPGDGDEVPTEIYVLCQYGEPSVLTSYAAKELTRITEQAKSAKTDFFMPGHIEPYRERFLMGSGG